MNSDLTHATRTHTQNLHRAPPLAVVRAPGGVGWGKRAIERSVTYTYVNYTTSEFQRAFINHGQKYQTFCGMNRFRPVNCVLYGVSPMPKRFRLTGPDVENFDDPEDEANEDSDDDGDDDGDKEEEYVCYRNEVHPNEVTDRQCELSSLVYDGDMSGDTPSCLSCARLKISSVGILRLEISCATPWLVV
jgi:hypothetical protein